MFFTNLWEFFQTPTMWTFYELTNNTPLTSTNVLHNMVYLYSITNPSTASIPFVLKLTLCLVMLIVIRGGVPRYRYDLLTKMGWMKFLLIVLTVFLTSMCLLLFAH